MPVVTRSPALCVVPLLLSICACGGGDENIGVEFAITTHGGTPKSEAMRVTERYTLSADGERLDIEFNVEDPKTFTTAWSAKVAYTRVPPRSGEALEEAIFAEIICPENNRDAAGGGYPIPMATTRDF